MIVIAAAAHGGVELAALQRGDAAVGDVDDSARKGICGVVVTRLAQQLQHGVRHALAHGVQGVQPQPPAAPEVGARVLPLKPQIGPTAKSLQRVQTLSAPRILHLHGLQLKRKEAGAQGAQLCAGNNAERERGHGSLRDAVGVQLLGQQQSRFAASDFFCNARGMAGGKCQRAGRRRR
jgi:hypothetical protein